MSVLAPWLQSWSFAWPWAWLALPLPWLAMWLLPARGNPAPALKVPYGPQLEGIAAGTGIARSVALNPLAVLAWLLLVVAVARPQELGPAVVPPQSGRDMLLAVDLSGSMGSPDMQLGGGVVDRLTAAKAVLADFLDRRTGDRVGLLVFGQRAYMVTPLTLDHDSVRQQLKDLVPGLAGRETAIGDAIALATKRLREQPTGERVVILLTDGVSNAGTLLPEKAAELARDSGVRVHTIAFGSDGQSVSLFGMQLPMPGGSDDSVDEASLQQVARTTGGRFFRARDTRQLAGIYDELNRIEPVQRPGQAVRPRIERYPAPLALALACTLLAFAWRSLRR